MENSRQVKVFECGVFEMPETTPVEFSAGYGWLTRPGLTFDESKPISVPNLMGQKVRNCGMSVIGGELWQYLKMTSKHKCQRLVATCTTHARVVPEKVTAGVSEPFVCGSYEAMQ